LSGTEFDARARKNQSRMFLLHLFIICNLYRIEWLHDWKHSM